MKTANSTTLKQKLRDGTGLKPVFMSEEMARAFQEKMSGSATITRKFIYAMFMGGYKALGYESFLALVIKEFGKKAKSQMYREKDVAIIEKILGYSVGTIKKGRRLEPLTKLAYEDDVIFVWDIGLDRRNGSMPSANLLEEIIIEEELIKPKLKPQPKPKVIIKAIVNKLDKLPEVTDCKEVLLAVKTRIQYIEAKADNDQDECDDVGYGEDEDK